MFRLGPELRCLNAELVTSNSLPSFCAANGIMQHKLYDFLLAIAIVFYRSFLPIFKIQSKKQVVYRKIGILCPKKVCYFIYSNNFCSNDDFFFEVGIHYQRVVLYNGLQPIGCSPKIY